MTDKIKEIIKEWNKVVGAPVVDLVEQAIKSEAAREYWVSSKDEEIARLKEGVKELVECLDLIVGSMSLERVERFELNEKAKSLIQKHEQ